MNNLPQQNLANAAARIVKEMPVEQQREFAMWFFDVIEPDLFRIVESESYKEAMDDIENGRVYRAESIESMIADCLA